MAIRRRPLASMETTHPIGDPIAIPVRGFDQRMDYVSEDHEFGYRPVDADIRPRHIDTRQSAFRLTMLMVMSTQNRPLKTPRSSNELYPSGSGLQTSA